MELSLPNPSYYFGKYLKVYRRLPRFVRKVLALTMIFSIVFTSGGLLYLFGPFKTQAEAVWFNESWSYRKLFVVNEAQVSGSSNLTDFPVLVKIDEDKGIALHAQSDFDDIAFATPDGTQLKHEIEKYTATTGELIAWVKIPTLLGASNTPFYLYYGNPSASDQRDANNTWNGEYEMIQHLEETSGTTTSDSTANGNTGTKQGSGEPAVYAAGKINGAQDWDGSNDNIRTTTTNFSTGDFTYEAWIYNETVDRIIFDQPDGGTTTNEFHMRIDSLNQLAIATNGTFTLSTTGTLNLNTWYHVAVTRSGSTLTAYINGAADATTGTDGTALTFSTCNFIIGAEAFAPGSADCNTTNTYANFWNGRIDEVRVSSTPRSADWLATTFNTTNNPSSFYASVGGEEKAPAPLLYWKFDDGTGTTAQDASLSNLDGTISGATWQTDDMCIAGKCLYLDGTDDNITIADNSALDFIAAASFSVSAWVKHSGANATASDYIITKASGATYTGYKMYMDDTGDFCFNIRDGTNAEDTACTSGIDFDDDKWHYVVGVKSGTSSITLYVDGNQRAQDASIASTGTLANSGAFYVGVDSDGTSNEWKGFIDEVRVVDGAHTAANIKAFYNARGSIKGAATRLGSDPNANLANGLVGYWKLDESSGDAADSSGNATTLTNVSTTAYTAAKYGNGMEPDGTADYFQASDNAPLSVTGSLTLSAWIQPDDTTGSQDIIAKWDGANESYLLAMEGADLRMYIDSASNYQASTGTPITANALQHVAGVYDAATQTVKLFVNGAEVASSTTGTIPASIGDDAGRIQLGAEDSTTSAANFYDGHIDEARVYNRALSSAEISQLYNWAPGPSIHLKMDEKTGTTVSDSSGNSKNGAFGTDGANAPSWSLGKYGAGVDFGDSDVVTVASPGLSTTDFTWAFWFNADAADGRILSVADGSADTAEVSIYYNSIRQFEIQSNANQFGPSTAYSLGTWHHVALTRLGSSAQFYVNGVAVASQTDATAYTFGSCPLLIGAGNGDATNCSLQNTYSDYFDGKVDDIRVYTYARSAKQVVEDMNAGHPVGGSPVASQVVYHKFDEGADNTCSGGTNDVCNSGSAGTTFDGTSTATRSNSGKFGKALDFDGSDDVVTLTNATGIDLNDNLAASHTFSVWINPDSDGEGDVGQVYQKGTNTYLRVDSQSGSNLDVEASLDLATSDATVNVSAPITTGAWNHIAVMYTDDSDDEIEVYINGRLRGTSTNGSGAPAADTNNLLIGGTITANFDGKIDEFKVYSSALTAAELAIDMNRGSGQVLGALGDNSNYDKNAANQEYCIPGDATSCAIPATRFDLNQKTGQTLHDSVNAITDMTLGNDATVTSNDPTWTTGKIGGALKFDGSDDYTSTATNLFSGIISASTGTLEAWIKPMGTAQTCTTGYSQCEGILGDAGGFGGITRGNFDGTDRIRFINDDGGGNPGDSVDFAYTTNTWYHVVWVHSGGTLYGYVNGVLQGSTASGNTAGTASDFQIGKLDVDSFNGIIDNVRIFSYARSAAQIAYDYNRGLPLAHWKMDECTGTTINDSAGNSFTGTLTIGATGGEDTVGTCTTSSTAWGSGVTGKRNYSIDLDGTDDYIQVSDTANLRFDDATSDFSLFAWVKRGANGEMNVVSKEDADNDGYRLQFTSGNVVRCSVDAVDVDSTLTITDTDWHLVGCTIDRDGNGQVYLDGKANGTATAISSEVMATTSNIRLGTRSYTSTNYLDGQLDDVRIYNYTLTATQVKDLYNGGAVRFGPTTGAP